MFALHAGERVRRIRRYPREEPAKAIERASRKPWWPERVTTQPSITSSGRRWAWITKPHEEPVR